MRTAPDLTSSEWPNDRWADALGALARTAHVGSRSLTGPTVQALDATLTFAEALPDRARAVGLDVEPIDYPPVDPLATLRRAAPAIVASFGGSGFRVVLRAGRKTAILLGPEGPVRVPITAVEDALWGSLDRDGSGVVPDAAVARLFHQIDSLSARRRSAAARVLRAPGLIGRPLGEGWIVRPIVAGMKDGLRAAKLTRRFASVIAAYFAQFALFLAIWSQAGAHVFVRGDSVAGDRGQGWGGFMILLALWVAVQLLASAAVSRLALDVGAVVRAGLMRGALRLDPGRIRTAGVGQLLGRALDAEVLDALALGGGVEATAGIFELLLGVVILSLGASPASSLAILGLVLGGLGAGTMLHARRLHIWSDTRRAMTHDLVERMIGHRTALIQDRPARRAAADTAALGTYDRETRALDRVEVGLSVGLARVWLFAGLLALAPLAFSSGDIQTQAIAMSLAGVWLVYGALRRLGSALPMLSLARDAWGQSAPLVGDGAGTGAGAIESDLPQGSDADAVTVATAATTEVAGTPGGADSEQLAPLIEAEGVAYRYPDRPIRVLEGVILKIAAGDRVLVEGASGGGKSTLAGLLTGLKTPAAGRLRLRGLDQRTIGLVRWRRAVGGAPQFHDNHVIGAELLFNLLMGRRWPPRIEDIGAAERVCDDLGLGPLIKRMPAGIVQLVGETGWQLSHGERSRLFIARSLLQFLDARVLDESFAALDPETLDEVLAAVLARPEALVVIAHP